ncbi:uncharacterized protein LOC134258362 [Saccostrea cucullata]|uniref:uncharacterized protein LOC134258362 n=1 Tax=Saccostrea cuccullata TaxID=36930 RepID=UPI002ED49E56
MNPTWLIFSWSISAMVITIADTIEDGSTTVSNVSAEYLLWISNERQYEINRPSMIIHIITIIWGLIGNSLVIYVFGIRFKKSTANVFVTCLAVFDTIMCFLLILETLDLRFPMYSGDYPALCKMVRFIEGFIKSFSIILLICVALNRYYKICKPHKHISVEKVKKILIASFVAAMIFSWPALLFHGSETMVTHYPRITGNDCAADDKFKGSLYSAMYFIFILVIISCCIVVLLALYCFVIWTFLKRKFTAIEENQDSAIWYSNTSYHFQRSSNISLIRKIQSGTDTEQRLQSNFTDMAENFGKENNSNEQKPDRRTVENKHQSRFVVLGEQNKSTNGSENVLTPESQNKTELQNTPIPLRGILKNKLEDNNKMLNKSAIAYLSGQYEAEEEFRVSDRPKKTVSFMFSIADCDEHPKVTPSEPEDNSNEVSQRHLALNVDEEEIVDTVLLKTKNINTLVNKQNSGAKENDGSITITFCLITVIYVLCYIPTLVVESMNAVQPFNLKEMSTTAQQFMVLAYSAYFMNLLFKPLIYSVFNKQFRDEIILIWTDKFK